MNCFFKLLHPNTSRI